jgi:branched-chain amino acid transport system substrate-binding protein
VTSTTLTAESLVDLEPAEVYGLFGTSAAGSWLFDARCQSLTVGTAVSLQLPIDGDRRFGVELIGRLSEIKPNRSIVIEHVQPWRGRLRLLFEPAGPRRTRLRVRADVSAFGVEWLVRRSGAVLPVPPVAPDAVRIGVVTNKSGPGAVYALATEYLAELAVDEINDTGGIAGRRLDLLVADDATDPATAATEARRLVRSGCRAIFASTTSSSFAGIRKAIGPDDALLVHAAMNERGVGEGASVVRLGEHPSAQIEALAGRVMRATGARNWFLVGEDYSWSYGAHSAARRVVPQAAGRVIDEVYTPLGTTDFAAVIERIGRSGADIVLSSLVGSDEVAFQQQSAAAGLRHAVHAVSLVMDESTCEHIGPAAQGIWTAQGYFQDGPAAGNSDLVARYRAAYGRWAPPLSTLSETVYEAILQYAKAVRNHIDDHVRQQGRALREHCAPSRGTEIGTRNLFAPQLFLAEVRSGAPRVFDKAG